VQSLLSRAPLPRIHGGAGCRHRRGSGESRRRPVLTGMRLRVYLVETRSAPAAWAWSTAPSIPSSIAPSRSSFSPMRSRPGGPPSLPARGTNRVLAQSPAHPDRARRRRVRRATVSSPSSSTRHASRLDARSEAGWRQTIELLTASLMRSRPPTRRHPAPRHQAENILITKSGYAKLATSAGQAL